MQKLFSQRRNRITQMNEYRQSRSTRMIREIPEDLFKNCSHCGQSVLYETWIEQFHVCPNCNFHHRLKAIDRIELLIDQDSFIELDKKLYSKDEENFFEYRDKLDIAMQKSKLNEAVVTGYGMINRKKVAIGVMDSNFMMGSMGKVVGEKITRLIEFATRKKYPLIIVSTSGGARMQEGILSLMQMAKTSSALKRHSDAGLLYISILSDPTTGGVSASFAMLGDIIVSEPNALIGFAGKRVIEQTIGEKLDDHFQKSEFLLEHGFIDFISERKDLKQKLTTLLRLHEVR